MDQIVAFVSQKTGLSPDQSKKAVDAALSFLKTRLPAPLGAQLEAALADGELDAGDVTKALGGMFAK